MYRILCRLLGMLSLLILHRAVGNDVRIKEDEYSHSYNILDFYQRFHDRKFVKENFGGFLQTSKCSKDIAYTLESLTNVSNPWALRLVDSFAKPPQSGILIGNFFWVGEYNECIKVYAPLKAPNSTTGNFHGQYCSLTFNISLLNKKVPLKSAICLPDSCSPQDLLEESRFPALDNRSLLENVTITCWPRERHLTAAAISVIVLLSIFCAFALVGSTITIVKYCKELLQEEKGSILVINVSDKDHAITNQNGGSQTSVESGDTSVLQNDRSSSKGFGEKCEAFLNCFCVFTNGAKLLNTDSSEGQLLCIHGIRFLSMSWVMLGHTYSYGVPSIRNVVEAADAVDDFAFQAVIQGHFAVDSFFLLSGFLLTYLAMKEFSKRKGSMNWIYFYVHRYIRLTPIYMIVLGFSASVYFYFGSGPYWPLGDFDPGCRKDWWWSLLYINNFVKQTDQCMVWAWYLANDMQFFIISPIFLISLWRWPKIGYSLFGVFLLSCMLSNFFITYHFDLAPGLAGFGGNLANMDRDEITSKSVNYFEKVYIKPYTRIGTYLIGVILGYLLFKHKTSNRPKLGWPYLCIGWIVASAVTLASVYGLYHTNPSLVARSFYSAFSRICFGCGLAWVIYVCLTNQSYIINSILSYKLFIPLSRLTYSAYLIHPLIMMIYFNSLKQPLEFYHPTMVYLFFGFMTVTYALALPVSLILESPIVSLEKIIRSKFNKV